MRSAPLAGPASFALPSRLTRPPNPAPPRSAAQGKQLIFVTNNSTKSRAGYLKKFTDLGLSISANEIYSSSYAAAAYLESIRFPKDKKASSVEAGCRQAGRDG